jgi:hypothetical protein
MNMAMEAAPPRRSPQRKSVSPHKKQRPSLCLIPTTRRPSIKVTSSFSNNKDIDGVDDDFGFSEKNALFQSFSDLCHDVGFSDKNALSRSFPDLCLGDFLDLQEEDEKEPQKLDFMASLVDFLDSDEILDDSKLNKMVTEWQASTDAVAGGTKEEVEFNTSLANLFGSFTDLLTNKRGFDKEECLTLQQEMDRLKKMRRRMAMAAELKPDFSGFPEASHSPTARSRKPVTLGREHDSVANVLEYALEGWQGDVVPLQEERGRRDEEVFEEQKRGTESRGDPIILPSRSSGIENRGEPVTPQSRSPTRRSEEKRRSPKTPSRRLHKSNDDDENSEKLRQSGSTGRRETSVERRHRRSKASGSKATEHSSPVRSSPKSVSPRRTITPLPGELSSLMLSPRHPSKQRDLLGVSSCHSKSPRKRIGLAATLHKSSSRKEGAMSLSGTTTHTSRSMPASRSPRKSSRTSGQSDPIRSHNTPRKLRSKASSPVRSPKSPRKALQIDLLGVSPLKSPRSPRKSFQKDSLGLSESIRAVQLYGTPRRTTEKGSTSRTSAKPDQSPSSVHHLAMLNGRSSVPDFPKTVSRRSSQEGRPRPQSQTGGKTTLSLKELIVAPPVYSSAEKEDLAPKQPSRGRRNSQERQPTSRNRAHSVAPDAEKESRSSSRRSSAIATSGATSLSRRRSNSVAPEAGSSRVRLNSVTRDAKKSSGRSHLDLVSRSQHRASRRPSLGSIQSSML